METSKTLMVTKQTCMINGYEDEDSPIIEPSDVTTDIIVPNSAELRTDLSANSSIGAGF